jgi:hypothetical protein
MGHNEPTAGVTNSFVPLCVPLGSTSAPLWFEKGSGRNLSRLVWMVPSSEFCVFTLFSSVSLPISLHEPLCKFLKTHLIHFQIKTDSWLFLYVISPDWPLITAYFLNLQLNARTE